MVSLDQNNIAKGIMSVFPTLDREDRISLIELFEKSAKWNIDFIVMMGLAKDLDATVDEALEEDIKVRVATLKGTVDDFFKRDN